MTNDQANELLRAFDKLNRTAITTRVFNLVLEQQLRRLQLSIQVDLFSAVFYWTHRTLDASLPITRWFYMKKLVKAKDNIKEYYEEFRQ